MSVEVEEVQGLNTKVVFLAPSVSDAMPRCFRSFVRSQQSEEDKRKTKERQKKEKEDKRKTMDPVFLSLHAFNIGGQ